MDKILSARVDQSTVDRITRLARRLNTSKKKVLESAVALYAAQVDEEEGFDALDQTFGSWRRKESPEKTLEHARRAFRQSMTRHHK